MVVKFNGLRNMQVNYDILKVLFAKSPQCLSLRKGIRHSSQLRSDDYFTSFNQNVPEYSKMFNSCFSFAFKS